MRLEIMETFERARDHVASLSSEGLHPSEKEKKTMADVRSALGGLAALQSLQDDRTFMAAIFNAEVLAAHLGTRRPRLVVARDLIVALNKGGRGLPADTEALLADPVCLKAALDKLGAGTLEEAAGIIARLSARLA